MLVAKYFFYSTIKYNREPLVHHPIKLKNSVANYTHHTITIQQRHKTKTKTETTQQHNNTMESISATRNQFTNLKSTNGNNVVIIELNCCNTNTRKYTCLLD